MKCGSREADEQIDDASWSAKYLAESSTMIWDSERDICLYFELCGVSKSQSKGAWKLEVH